MLKQSRIDHTVPAMDVSLVEARQVFETNFFAVILMCQTFLPLLIKAQGTIVQIGSLAGVRTNQQVPLLLSTCNFRPVHTNANAVISDHTLRVRLGLQCLQSGITLFQ